jgi:hypothetical protein
MAKHTTRRRDNGKVGNGGMFDKNMYGFGKLDVLTTDELAARRKQLEDRGYVPAVSSSTSLDPTSTKHLRAWWDEKFVTAEVGGAKGSYAVMPDDYTPGMTSGEALSGHRRTHRMLYEGAGVKLRMPSATSIRKFSKENGDGRTFDVPVSAEYDGGTVQGMVRVTRVGKEYHVDGLGFSDAANEQVAEAVSAVLGSRRVTTALAHAGNLAERRRARIADEGTALVDPKSSWIEGMGYEDDQGMMVMTTKPQSRKDGTQSEVRQYGFRVSRATFEAVIGNERPGAAFNELVKGQAARIGVSKCDKCARFMPADGSNHVCPTVESDRLTTPTAANRLYEQAARARLASYEDASTPEVKNPTADEAAAALASVPEADSFHVHEDGTKEWRDADGQPIKVDGTPSFDEADRAVAEAAAASRMAEIEAADRIAAAKKAGDEAKATVAARERKERQEKRTAERAAKEAAEAARHPARVAAHTLIGPQAGDSDPKLMVSLAGGTPLAGATVHGRRGFITDSIGVLGPHSGAQYGQVQQPSSGILTVDGIPNDEASRLLDTLPAGNLDASLNAAPTARQFLTAARNSGGKIEVGGVVVMPNMRHEGFYPDTATVYAETEAEAREIIGFSLPDARPSDVVTGFTETPWRPGETAYQFVWTAKD